MCQYDVMSNRVYLLARGVYFWSKRSISIPKVGYHPRLIEGDPKFDLKTVEKEQNVVLINDSKIHNVILI